MTIFKSLSYGVVFGSAIVGHAALPVRAGDLTSVSAVLTPLNAKAFDLGDKRAIAFYETAGKACKITVFVADRMDDSGKLPSASVRFDSQVAAGTSATVGLATGPDIGVTCGARAANLSISVQPRVAYGLPSRN